MCEGVQWRCGLPEIGKSSVHVLGCKLFFEIAFGLTVAIDKARNSQVCAEEKKRVKIIRYS